MAQGAQLCGMTVRDDANDAAERCTPPTSSTLSTTVPVAVPIPLALTPVCLNTTTGTLTPCHDGSVTSMYCIVASAKSRADVGRLPSTTRLGSMMTPELTPPMVTFVALPATHRSRPVMRIVPLPSVGSAFCDDRPGPEHTTACDKSRHRQHGPLS